MRFSRRPRIIYEITDRERAAAQRWQQRQRDALPLLADLVAEHHLPIEQVMTERVERWDLAERSSRPWRAARWREARRRLDDYPPDIRGALLRYWNEHRWLPGEPSYLLDTLHGFDTGRLILSEGSIRQARVVISVSEAVAIGGRNKPVSRGWFG